MGADQGKSSLTSRAWLQALQKLWVNSSQTMLKTPQGSRRSSIILNATLASTYQISASAIGLGRLWLPNPRQNWTQLIGCAGHMDLDWKTWLWALSPAFSSTMHWKGRKPHSVHRETSQTLETCYQPTLPWLLVACSRKKSAPHEHLLQDPICRIPTHWLAIPTWMLQQKHIASQTPKICNRQVIWL